MDRIHHIMHDPSKLSDPHATVVPINDDVGLYPQIAGYRMLRRLGQGGMATVYLATQESLDRPVSIKVMESASLQDETSKQRFENEARTIARLTHPSIVSIHEVGRTIDGRLYYSMPYLPNGDLSQRDLSKDEARIVDVLRALLSALDYAHARDIVHRDVKRENVLFDTSNHPQLADFGIAMSTADTVRITTAGFAVGSSGYMAPEQARGDAVDGRADLYSVGVLAYELLTGELPFRSNDPLAIALMHAQKDIPRLPPAKRHWQAFIDKAMAKSPEQRFENAQQMLGALDRIGRRSGNHLSQRVLRTLDRTAPANGWGRPRMAALGASLLLAGGLFAARDHLPSFGGSPTAFVQKHAIGATPTAVTHLPARAAVAATVASASASPTTTAHAVLPPPVMAPKPALPPTPAVPAPTAATVALGHARSELDHHNLVSPPGKNAVDLSLAAWELAPATNDTRRLVDDVLKALSLQEALAIGQRDDQRVVEYQQKAELLDNATVGQSTPAWRAFRAATTSALLERARYDSRAGNNAALATTKTLAKQLGVPLALAMTSAPPALQAAPPATTDGFVHAPSNPLQPNALQPPANANQRLNLNANVWANIDPGFVKLHGPVNGYPAAAIARTEVTRHDYAAFAIATGRPATDCTNPKAAAPAADAARFVEAPPRFGQGGARFGRGLRKNWGGQATQFQNAARKNKNWREPGFPQSGDHPVVCVNWNDANAYAQWLGQRNGHRYRMASNAEWRIAIASGAGSADATDKGTSAAASGSANALGLYGLDGNVSEWLQDCTGGCERHLVAGRSWRDRGTDLNASGRLSERAFDDVGFRLVQVLGGRN